MKPTLSLMFAKSLIFPKTEKKSSARRSFFGALICIGLSIIPMVVVLSITNGMIDGMTQRLIGLSTSHIKGYVANEIVETSSAYNFRAYANSLLKEYQITCVNPEVDITALATGKKNRTGIQIRGIDADLFRTNDYFAKYFTVLDGDINQFEEEGLKAMAGESKGSYAVIGQKAAEILELKVGDSFRVITTKQTNGIVTPRITSFKVCAIVSSGYQELDAFWVFIPLETAYSKLSLANANYNILISTKDAFSADLVALQRKLQTKYGQFANFYRWDELHRAEFSNFSSTKVMLIFIMLLIVLIATVNISSCIVMMVIERKKEIAILKSMGAKPKEITASFILSGICCAGGGLLFGVPIGLLLCVNANSIAIVIEKIVNYVAKIIKLIKGIPLEQITAIKLMDPAYYLQEITFDIPFWQLFIIILSTLFLAFLVSIIPSVKAGKEKPLDILRKA